MESKLKTVGFDSELDLVKSIVACTKRSKRREYRVELEVDASVGIADIILVKRSARSTSALKALARVNPRLAVLLSNEVASKVTCLADLARCLGASENAAQKVFAQLASWGLAFGTPDRLLLGTVVTLPFEKIIAVEAKLSDWKRVLVQAYRNLQFADESWVVLDNACVNPALAQLERFKKTGVGLASLDRVHQGLSIHLSAAQAGPVSITKRWQAQAVLAARAVNRLSLSKRF